MIRAAIAAILLGLALAPAASARTPAELVLVLAVDTSASVNYNEFALQMSGVATAFRDPVVVAAIEALGPNGIAVCLFQWSGGVDSTLAVDWHHLRTAADMERFAQAVDSAGRLPNSSGTALGSALRDAVKVVLAAPFEAARRIIDISGDGRANQGAVPEPERDIAGALGITVNGLAIVNEEPELDAYYLRSIVVGPDSFVMVAADYEDFARAMRLKLLREIGGSPVSMR